MIARIAFAGFRHPHIMALWKRVQEHPECQIVGAWENDTQACEQLRDQGQVGLTYESFEEMLVDSPCTIVAVGDVYARRGALVIAALRAGKHVISDKPICTHLAELDEIAALVKQNNLFLGCQLDLVESGTMRQLQRVILEGTIGNACTISIAAQHPLRVGSRAAWYFEPGLHGGTINDIGIHAFDLATWLTGSNWRDLLVAREWNSKAVDAPHFKDCAQFLAVQESGVSCFADLSYLAPEKLGYELPQYWRVTVHGTKGMAEACYNFPFLTVVTDEDDISQKLPAMTEPPNGYLQDFLDEISGKPTSGSLTTSRILCAARKALEAQVVAQQSTS